MPFLACGITAPLRVLCWVPLAAGGAGRRNVATAASCQAHTAAIAKIDRAANRTSKFAPLAAGGRWIRTIGPPVKDQLVETVLFGFPAEARKRTIGGRRSQPRDLGAISAGTITSATTTTASAGTEAGSKRRLS